LVSNGTGTPVSKGFDQYEVISIINQIILSRKVICVEFAEINPLVDTKGNKMAEAAFEVLEQITSTIILPIE
jgi:arginase